MSDKKISALPPATTPLTGTETLPIVQGGTTVKVPVSDLTTGRNISTGNIGVGIAPSSWDTGHSLKAIELLSGGMFNYFDNQLYVIENAYYDGTSFKYKATAAASSYQQWSGSHYWNVAPSGTSGNAAAFSTAMSLDNGTGNLTLNSGNLVIDTSGKGIVLTSPDGLITKTLSINNAGLIALI